jgi:hypothetical protein
MKRLVAVLLTSLVAVPGRANAGVWINCPLDRATRTITERLPPEWWTTSVVDRLSATRVEEVGGEPTLVCIYGRSGSVLRRAPSAACHALPGRFRCE